MDISSRLFRSKILRLFRSQLQIQSNEFTFDILKNITMKITYSYRVRRGGSWINSPRGCQTAYPFYDAPTLRFNYVGFRLLV